MTAENTPPRDSPMAEGLLGGSTGSVSGLGERLSVRNDEATGVLQDAGLLGGGGRDRDRLRLIKYVVNHPEGVAIAKAVKDVFGKDSTGGGDPDYQVARRLYTENPTYFDTFQQNRLTTVEPKLDLLDLIAQGITQKSPSDRDGDLPSNAAGGASAERDDFVPDKAFAADMLASVPSLSDKGKGLLAHSLERYVDRINDYRLLFEAEVLGGRGGSSTFVEDYKTRFNDEGRIRKNWGKYNAGLRYGRENFDNAALATLTTDPKKQDGLLDGIESINKNFNRLMSWMAYKPKTRPSSRPGYRPPYMKFLEFSEAGYPHLHVLFFDVPERNGQPWLINKGALSNKWDDLGQGRIVDLEGLKLKENLPGCYDVEDSSGFVAYEEVRDAERAQATAREVTLDLMGDGPAAEVAAESAGWVADRVAHYDKVALRGGESGEDGSGEAGGEDEGEGSRAVADGGEDALMAFGGQTAGQYVGKYLSATFGGVLDLATGEDFEAEGKYVDKAETYKIAMYWATGRKMWSLSRDIEEAIAPDEPEEVDLPVVVEFVGTFLYWDLPAQVLSAARPLAELEDARFPSEEAVGGEDGDRPPPEPAD